MKFLIEKLDKNAKVLNSEEIEVFDRDEAIRIILDRSNLRLTVIEEPLIEEVVPTPKVESLPHIPKGGEKNGKNTND